MDEEKRKCWSCVKYKAFYTKGTIYFDKRDIGFCQQRKRIVAKRECCENWGYNIVTKYNRKRMMLLQLADILNKLTVIEQTLKNEMELDDINLNEIK